MKKYLTVLALLLAAVSCGKGELTDLPQTTLELTFTADAVAAYAGGNATRTSLGADWSVSWVEGDQVSILWKGGRAVSQAVPEGGKVSFGAVVDEASDYYAVYPASVPASVDADGRLTLQIPSVQGGSFADCAVIVAHTTRESLDFGRFHSAVSMIRFTVDSPGVSLVRFGAADSGNVCGRISCDESLATFSAEAETASIDVRTNGAGTYYLAMLPGLSLPGLRFSLGNESGWKGTATSTEAVSLEAGDLLCIKTTLDSHIEVEGNIHVSVEGSGSKDGSSAENAADAEFLRTLLASSSSGSQLDGRTVFVSSGTYDLAVGDKGLSLAYDVPAHITIQGEEGTVFTTSLSGAEGCILTVASEGVNLVVKGISFTGASHDGTGGAVCLTKGHHVFQDCTFSGNECTSTTSDRTGGAVYVGGSATADFAGCCFDHNKVAVTGGGALAFHSSGLSTVTGCRFTENGLDSIGNGGAILQKAEGSLLYVVGSSFDSNACKTNGSDIFSSKGDALMLYNCTGINPVNGSPGNLGFVRANAPMLIAGCTYSAEKVGEANGCVSFGVSGTDKNMAVGNLVVCQEGNSFSSAFTNSNPDLKRTVASGGFNVFTKAPNITWEGEGVVSDLVGVDYSTIFSSPAALSADGVMLWEGPAAVLPSFTPASASDIESAIGAYPQGGQAFLHWLKDKEIFAVDGSGNSRGNASWWPGAYQKAE